jgi:hypothetical protein
MTQSYLPHPKANQINLLPFCLRLSLDRVTRDTLRSSKQSQAVSYIHRANFKCQYWALVHSFF